VRRTGSGGRSSHSRLIPVDAMNLK
jgi:hypothetical protein